MEPRRIALLGLPVDEGAGQPGCLMGPDAYRTAGLAGMIRALGHEVTDLGRVVPVPSGTALSGDARRAAVMDWVRAILPAAQDAAAGWDIPVFLGGDHSLTAGTLPGVAAHAARLGRPQFVLWLDAHSDVHTLDTSETGNLHGTPLAYALGLPGCEAYPPLPARIEPGHVCMMGLRSVDPAERRHIAELGLDAHDMRSIDKTGVTKPLLAFLDRVRQAKGRLHVSFDVDFLDPAIAPAVGTTVPGGATFREAHLIMELLHDSGLVTSVDLVELNPFLDHAGQTTRLMSDLCASLLGRSVLDRPTRMFRA
ncbi:arginase [Palleronia sp. KMU-117]|uniref:arginase n=1 Tax=Palleronia sp. KMU-117 TaxID=3434108 RepID=UPI003D74ABBC